MSRRPIEPTYISYQEWIDTFKPVMNDDDELIDIMGDEKFEGMDSAMIWTLVDAEPYPVVVSGYAFVNRLAYYLCKVPVPEGMFYEESSDD